MRRNPRNHSPAFKAKVALAAIKEQRKLAELSQQFDVHADQITRWKRQLVERTTTPFDNGSSAQDSQAQIKDLHAKIGELTVERDFLERGLARFDTKRGGSGSMRVTSSRSRVSVRCSMAPA